MSRLRDRFRGIFNGGSTPNTIPLNTKRHWLDLQMNTQFPERVKMPHELENEMQDISIDSIDEKILNRIQGSMIGLAIGDAMGAHVEFRPREYLIENPVTEFQAGGTWGLREGQFTDDTSMALCLAASLIVHQDFSLYDQLVRYKWWFRNGYMSSTGECFDIGTATRESLEEFQRRQQKFAHQNGIQENMDFLSNRKLLEKFPVNCSREGVAGNGALMRLAPVALYFHRNPALAVKYCGQSAEITHGDRKAVDACRYYGALIVAVFQGYTKEQILDSKFCSIHKKWFNDKKLCDDITLIAKGSFKKPGGYDAGIRGSGYIVKALEAALWAFWSDEGSFENGILKAVNLGDDTDTTAAIYGQLAGAYYGYRQIPPRLVQQIYAKNFILNISKWITYGSSRVSTSKGRHSPVTPSRWANGLSKPILVEHSSATEHVQPAIIPSTSILVATKSADSRLKAMNSIPLSGGKEITYSNGQAPFPKRTNASYIDYNDDPSMYNGQRNQLHRTDHSIYQQRMIIPKHQDELPLNYTKPLTARVPYPQPIISQSPTRTERKKTVVSSAYRPPPSYNQVVNGRAEMSTSSSEFSNSSVDPNYNTNQNNWHYSSQNSFINQQKRAKQNEFG